ncbi:hypothetical protein SGHV006 [Glossina pallidipes salivary gland hypertrophy virus]|uniref:Uncharacterized protein n=1 Tax=Glossina hytrovirus (isolate Glossina pallidipes/Ethiopia/Seibersdorf/-) TaxID=379529 RepID=B0YLG0_GHVS|nr:hypothetical protein SGHV006 [Glossina pallidipes salivary gland hypertrophy virus]ABQ08779.1 hypothetical protein SGHV006 [Glossina pallidipes salivary gland hypertrophy virus]
MQRQKQTVEITTNSDDFLFVLVPGLYGSKLYCNCCFFNSNQSNSRRLYPPYGYVGNINEHFYECKNITCKPLKKILKISIYEKFLKRMRKKAQTISLAYNWTDDPLENAKKLQGQLLDIIACKRVKNIIIIGHSMGGLIVRIMCEYLQLPSLHPTINFTFVICGTPFYGSLNEHDYNYDINDLKTMKPFFLLTSHDFNKMIDVYKTSISYLAPSNRVISSSNNEQIKKIHSCLSKFRFYGINYKYIFYYNLSHTTKIYRTMNIDVFNSNFNIGNFKVQNSTNTLIKVITNEPSDGKIIKPTLIPHNTVIALDFEYLPHALMLNSKYIVKILTNLMTTTTTTIDNNAPSAPPPSYESLYAID